MISARSAPAWQHPWLRINRLIRAARATRWGPNVWPNVKAAIVRAIVIRDQIERAGWFN